LILWELILKKRFRYACGNLRRTASLNS